MVKIPDDIVNRLKKIKAVDLRYENLGSDSHFVSAHNIKEEIIALVEQILTLIPQHSDQIPESIVQSFFTIMNSKLNELEDRCNQIVSLIGKGIHNQDFPQQRNQQLSEFERMQASAIRELYNIKEKYELIILRNMLNSNETISKAISESKDNLKESEKLLVDSKKILGDIRDVSFVKTLKESAGSFDILRKNHTTYQKNWFITFSSSIALIIASVLIIISSDVKYNSTNELIVMLVKKILFIGLPALLARISLKKYNIERNLKIIYDHRATVLEQYTHFENAIGDDPEAKNRFRLEIAKYIFSDPNTGYLEDHSSSDLSVNPIFNLAENYVRKQSAN